MSDFYSQLLSLHVKRFVTRPRHHSAVAALQHKHVAFSGAVRIFKRWLSSHLLSPHVCPEMAEILVAHVFLCPGAQSVPASPGTAFARTLALLARWDWRTSTLLTPLYSAVEDEAEALAVHGRVGFPEGQAIEAHQHFEHTRKADPHLRRGPMLFATEKDLKGREWSWHAPSRVVAQRLVDIAKASLTTLEAGLQEGDLDTRVRLSLAFIGRRLESVQVLFSTPLDAYDFVIHLDRAQLPRYSQAINADASHLHGSKSSHKPVALGFDPAVLLLERLQSFFGDTALLFHDLNGGALIAGVFDPSLELKREWRVHLGFPCSPSTSQEATEDAVHQVSLDREAIFAGVRRVAGGLVERIETKS